MIWKKMISLMIGLSLTVSLSSCSQAEKNTEADFADAEAMEVIATGFERRADKIDELQRAGKDTQSTANLKTIVQTELNIDQTLRNRQFKDAKLQEQIIAYINTLNDSVKLLTNSSTSSNGFLEQWNDIRDERSSLLKGFVDKYGLTVSDKYQESMDELTANGAAVNEQNETDNTINQLVETAVFNKQADGFGGFTYAATIQNTSNIAFENISIVLALYDGQNVKLGETYTSTNSWEPGETVLFEAYSNVDAATVRASVDYYDVAR